MKCDKNNNASVILSVRSETKGIKENIHVKIPLKLFLAKIKKKFNKIKIIAGEYLLFYYQSNSDVM